MHNTKVEWALLESLPSNVKALHVSNITDQGVACIAKLISLERLTLATPLISDEAIDDFAEITSLRSLDLGDYKISASGLARLKNALLKCKIDAHDVLAQ